MRAPGRAAVPVRQTTVVDIDAFTAVHAAEWDRLKELSSRRRLDGAESDELVRLYQSVATHLSTVRSAAPDPALVTRLSDVLNRARTRIAGTHERRQGEIDRIQDAGCDDQIIRRDRVPAPCVALGDLTS